MIKGTAENFDLTNREPVGLEDCGHILLQCSNCNAYLCDIWITKKDAPLKWSGRAECPFCGDFSFLKEWQGLFAPGGIAADEQGKVFLPAKNDERTGKDVTQLVNFVDEGNGQILFKVKRINNAAPCCHR